MLTGAPGRADILVHPAPAGRSNLGGTAMAPLAAGEATAASVGMEGRRTRAPPNRLRVAVDAAAAGAKRETVRRHGPWEGSSVRCTGKEEGREGESERGGVERVSGARGRKSESARKPHQIPVVYVDTSSCIFNSIDTARLPAYS